jgi:hypothetical protein
MQSDGWMSVGALGSATIGAAPLGSVAHRAKLLEAGPLGAATR